MVKGDFSITKPELIKKIENAPLDNDVEFVEIVSSMSKFFSRSKLADALRVSCPTIERWSGGMNLPYSSMRKPAFRCFVALLKNED